MNDQIPASQLHPFRHPAPEGFGLAYVETCGVTDRLLMVAKMSVQELDAVLRSTDPIQRTVRKAAERRLRKLLKAQGLP